MNKRKAELQQNHVTPFKKQKLLQSPPVSPYEHDPDQPEFVLTKEIADNTVLADLMGKQWRIGKPVGKGSFGEIFLASDDINKPVTNESAKYVAKIEPHSNGPLFVEIHCLLSTAKPTDEHPLPLGMPQYVASGSHYFSSSRYRFLILQRFKCDLNHIIKNRRVNIKHVLIIANQILDVLEHLHDNGYAHSDIKAENLMIGSCTYDKKVEAKRMQSASNTVNIACDQNKVKSEGEFSGTNPVRSCRYRSQESSDYYYEQYGRPYSMRNQKRIIYKYNDDDIEVNTDDSDDDDYRGISKVASKTKKRKGNKKKNKEKHSEKPGPSAPKHVTENHIFLIDFGLASKFVDSTGTHHPFCMDQRRAHDGTLEFTSRDAHMGAHSRRSDLECLGYNLVYWTMGSLPWKDEKLQNQPEQVHRMKEIFMTDVREMLKLIYGQQVPKFLGDYLEYVNNLAYDERPDYDYLRRLFQQEFTALGYKKSEMILSISDLKRYCVDIKKLPKSQDNRSDKIHNVKSIAKLGLLIPIKERLNSSHNSSFGSRISPKNLRSKADKIPKKQRNHFSWAEILSQDPDQIARQRAEKEFEREEVSETPNKYKGRPTYAILEIENKIKQKENNNDSKHFYEDNDYIHGYTKSMMEVVRRRNLSLSLELSKKQEEEQKTVRKGRRKSANPIKIVKPTGSRQKQSNEPTHDNFYIRPKRKNDTILTPPTSTDESSCSSNASSGSDACGKTIKRATAIHAMNNFPRKRSYTKKSRSRSSSHSSIESVSSTDEACTTSGISSSEFYDDGEQVEDDNDNDDDSRDSEDFHPVKKRFVKQETGHKRRRGRPISSKNKNVIRTISSRG